MASVCLSTSKFPLKHQFCPDTEEWAGRRRGEEERQRRLWRRSAAIGGVGLGGMGSGKEENQKRIWRRSAIGVGEEYVGGDWVDEWRRRGEEIGKGRGEDLKGRGEELAMRRRQAPGRGVAALGRRGGIVSYTDFGPIDLPPPQRQGFMRAKPDYQGRKGERLEEGIGRGEVGKVEGRMREHPSGEREEVNRVFERRGREPLGVAKKPQHSNWEPPSGPFLRNERGFCGLQQRR